jgi:hypothetical protein
VLAGLIVPSIFIDKTFCAKRVEGNKQKNRLYLRICLIKAIVEIMKPAD